jgi:WD40 repeat protein
MRLLQNTHARPITGLSFAPGGTSLVAGGSGGFEVWDLTASFHSFIPWHSVQYLYGCVYDPLGRWIYVSDYRSGFRLLPLAGGKVQPVPGSRLERHVISFDLTPDGRQLVMSRGGAGLNRVECWDVHRTGKFVAAWSIRDGEPVSPDEPYLLNQATWFSNGIAIRRDGRMVATAESRRGGTLGDAPFVVLRDGVNGNSLAELGRSATNYEIRLAFAPDGGSLYTWAGRVLERWDLAAGKLARRISTPGRANLRGLVVLPSGQLVITVSGDGLARYWEPVDLSPIQALKWKVGKLHSLAVSHDGMLAAAGGEKGQVVVWDVDV